MATDYWQRIRHQPVIGLDGRCRHDGHGKRHWLHQVGSRCSVCFVYAKHYELDSSRRCDECRP